MRLANTYRRNFRQKTPLSLVGGLGNTVDAVRKVDQRNILKPFNDPVRITVQSIVKLEIAAAVAVFLRGFRECFLFQKPLIELRWRDGGNYRLRLDGFTACRFNADRLSVLHQDTFDIDTGADLAPLASINFRNASGTEPEPPLATGAPAASSAKAITRPI